MNEPTGQFEDFRRMLLWREAQGMAAEVAQLVVSLPRRRDADVIANQLMRAAGSVPANITEGFGRYSRAAYRNHLSIARGSLFEVQSWLDLLATQGLITDGKRDTLLERASKLGKMLTVRMKSLDANSVSVKDHSAEYKAQSPMPECRNARMLEHA